MGEAGMEWQAEVCALDWSGADAPGFFAVDRHVDQSDGATHAVEGRREHFYLCDPKTFEKLCALADSLAPPFPRVVALWVNADDVAAVRAADPCVPVRSAAWLRRDEYVARYADGTIRCSINGVAYGCRAVVDERPDFGAFSELSGETERVIGEVFLGRGKL